MVFKKMQIVLGYAVSRPAFVTQILKQNASDDIDEYNPFYEGAVEEIVFPKNIDLYRFQCCSELNESSCIIGTTVHTYYRKYIKCDKCTDYTCCDTCIGETNNGYYDVDTILNKLVECDPIRLCPTCFADNKSPFLPKMKCTVCNRKWYEINPAHNEIYVAVMNDCRSLVGLKKDDPVEIPKFYFMLDDCVSCT